MKKFSLLLVLLLFACQSINDRLSGVKMVNVTTEETPLQTETHDQFESRTLNTLKADKKKTQVALFLPFSGKHKELAWSLFDAATLALFNNDTEHNIELVLVDSKDSKESAQKAFQEIIDRNIKIVIGPIFSSTVKAIEKQARKNKISVISFSNNQGLMGKTNDEGGVFLAGILPETQIDKIVGYAMEHGKYSFAIIAPKNQYGRTITDLLRRIVRNRDGVFVTSEFYDSNGRGLNRAVNHVINSFTIPEHLTEGKNKLKKDAVITDEDKSYTQVIMIPESGKILSKIITSIKKQNIDEREFQIIGTSQWDNISTLNNIYLLGSWFPAPENKKFRNFERVYYRSFNKFPPRIASIAYDATTAIAKISNQYKEGHITTIRDFTNFINPPKNGFEGIDGLFRFLPNGLVQRNLAVLQVGNGKFETLEKPTNEFLKY